MEDKLTLYDDAPVMLANGRMETDAEFFTRRYGVAAQSQYTSHPETAFNGQSPKIKDAADKLGAPVVRTWLQAQIFDLALFCGTQQHVTERQTAQIADMMMASFNVSAAEYCLFFGMIKTGEIDMQTSYIDGRALMKAMRRFVNDTRGNTIARIEREQRQDDRPTQRCGLLNLRDYNRTARANGHVVNEILRIPDELLDVDDETFLREYQLKPITL